MGKFLDSVPLSGILRIRELMYSVENPYRLDQGDVSFEAPGTVKAGMLTAIAANESHYLQTAGLPALRALVAAKLRDLNRIPIESSDEVMITNGGIHALYLMCQALLEPGDEVIVPDPEWPPAIGIIVAAGGVPVTCPLHESLDWRLDVDELAGRVTPRTRAIYLNSPNNPTGGVLVRRDLERIADLARERNLWVISDEAYEDILFDGAEHVSIASLPGMYERTLSLFTFSKSYAMTGLRLGYLAARDGRLRDRMMKILFFTTSNTSSVVQYGGIGGLDGSREVVERYRKELQARRDLFYEGLSGLGGVFTGQPPKGAFYAFVRIDPARVPADPTGGASARPESVSWRTAEYLIAGRIGCVPGVDFGPSGEGYIRFCFARERSELTGALESMRSLFARSG